MVLERRQLYLVNPEGERQILQLPLMDPRWCNAVIALVTPGLPDGWQIKHDGRVHKAHVIIPDGNHPAKMFYLPLRTTDAANAFKPEPVFPFSLQMCVLKELRRIILRWTEEIDGLHSTYILKFDEHLKPNRAAERYKYIKRAIVQ